MQLSARPPAASGARGRGAARGFTLIELMVTLVLVGLLLTLGLPSFTTWIRNSQVRSVAEALQDGVRIAQTEAVRRNQAVVLAFTNDANPRRNPATAAGGRNWVAQTVTSAFVADGATEFIRAGALADVASGVGIASTPAVDAICFNANGRLVASAAPAAAPSTASCAATRAVFDISHPGSDRALRIIVALGGQVRMCDPKRGVLSAAIPDGCPP